MTPVFHGIIGSRRWQSFLPVCCSPNYVVDLWDGSQPDLSHSLSHRTVRPLDTEGFRWMSRRNCLRETRRCSLSYKISNDRSHIGSVMWFSWLQGSDSSDLIVRWLVNFSESWHTGSCISTLSSLCGVRRGQTPRAVAACWTLASLHRWTYCRRSSCRNLRDR